MEIKLRKFSQKSMETSLDRRETRLHLAQDKTMAKKSAPEIRKLISIPLKNARNAHFITFRNLSDSLEHFAIIFTPNVDNLRSDADKNVFEAPMVRIHSECITGDVFGSLRCDCGQQLQESIELLSQKSGIVLYLRQEGRGIGLYNKLDTYKLQDLGLNTYEANRALNHPEDAREYFVAAEMLEAIGVKKVRLLTNNPKKIRGLESNGIIVEHVQETQTFANEFNLKYLKAKKEVTQHTLQI